MFRLLPSVAALLVATAWAAPALAQDFGDFKPAYPTEPGDWAGLGDDDDPISLEFGVRYWYSMGATNFNATGDSFSAEDTSQFGEAHLRIEDHSTNTYAKALAGYAFSIGGSYTDPLHAAGSGEVVDGKVGYAGADFGWNAFGDNKGSGIGFLAGYMYWNDSVNTDRSNYTTAESSSDIGFDQNTGETFVPGDSSPNNLDMHMLRLGVQGKAKLGEWIDVNAELAAVPYAKVDGTIGAHDTGIIYDTSVYAPGNVYQMRSSPTTMDGWGYGAMAEVMAGVHPTENLTVRLGGRAWYLQGTADNTFSVATIGNPSDSDAVNAPNFDTAPDFSNQNYIDIAEPFSLFRYGLLAEFSYAF